MNPGLRLPRGPSLWPIEHNSLKKSVNSVACKAVFDINLWSPYVIGQTIYIFMLWFVLLSFFPRLISAAADWMSAILPHMVWP